MSFLPSISIAVEDQTQIAEARRAAQSLAEQLGFSEVRRGEVGIVATELARNALIHGQKGNVLVLPNRSENPDRVDIIALDQGPGIFDLEKCLEDGYSTAGTPGNGLGAVARMANELQVFSASRKLTAVYAQMRLERSSAQNHSHVGAVCVPIKGERVSGDAWGYRRGADSETFIVVDGLGHGAGAAEAALEALTIFYDQPESQPVELIQDMHDALKKTRGAAVAIAQTDTASRTLRLAGVGNIAACILSPGKKPRAMVSHNGTVGHVMSRVQEFTFPWQPNDLLVMHSDGISSHWEVDSFPGLAGKHPSVIASAIFHQASRGRDDSTALVVRLQRAA